MGSGHFFRSGIAGSEVWRVFGIPVCKRLRGYTLRQGGGFYAQREACMVSGASRAVFQVCCPVTLPMILEPKRAIKPTALLCWFHGFFWDFEAESGPQEVRLNQDTV